MRKCFGSLIFLFLFFKYACAFILPFLVKHDDCTYFLLFSIRFLRLKKTSKNRKWKKPCFEVFGLKLVQKNHSRFFGFLFAELCKKKLPTVERSLCFPWKRIWDTDYTRLQQNRKLSLTGNENLASNELFVWNSPSIFVCTIHQTVQKRSSKYDISLNIEKKKDSKGWNRVKEETIASEEIWSWPDLTRNESFSFRLPLCFQNSTHHRRSQSDFRFRESIDNLSSTSLHSDMHQVQFAFQRCDSRANSRRIVVVSLEPGRTRAF